MESIPVIFSDAARMCKPMIVAGVGDIRRLLCEDSAVLVAPPKDVNSRCQAMIMMATGEQCRYDAPVRALVERFDVARTARKWLKQIEASTARRAVPPR